MRNWDYRFCWLRDATFTLYALLLAGYRDEARAWREWLLRAAAGRPQDLQMLYGVPASASAARSSCRGFPATRLGAGAHRQRRAAQCQLDVYGEVIDACCLARTAGLGHDDDAWAFQRTLLDFLETHWREPDNGIWEDARERQHFTHSKVMAWVAIDRAIRHGDERMGSTRPVARWRRCAPRSTPTSAATASAGARTFVQHYGRATLDASLLLMPIVGFLPPDDRARARHGRRDRARADGRRLRRCAIARRSAVDGLPPGEGVFLPCSFWLADALALLEDAGCARALFERLLALRNDVGLLAEEYDPRARAYLGNFPQALSHVALSTPRATCRRGRWPSRASQRHGAGASGEFEKAAASRTIRRSKSTASNLRPLEAVPELP